MYGQDQQLVEVATAVLWAGPVIGFLVSYFVIRKSAHPRRWFALLVVLMLPGVIIQETVWSFHGVIADGIAVALMYWGGLTMLACLLLIVEKSWKRTVLLSIISFSTLCLFALGWDDGLYTHWNDQLIRREWNLGNGSSARLHNRAIFQIVTHAWWGRHSVEIVESFGPLECFERTVSHQKFYASRRSSIAIDRWKYPIVDVRSAVIGDGKLELKYIFGPDEPVIGDSSDPSTINPRETFPIDSNAWIDTTRTR